MDLSVFGSDHNSAILGPNPLNFEFHNIIKPQGGDQNGTSMVAVYLLSLEDLFHSKFPESTIDDTQWKDLCPDL